MELKIRRVITLTDEMHSEGGKPLVKPYLVAVTAVVITNPLAGSFTEDLVPMRRALADPLGTLLSDRLASLLGAPAEAYGKGALVGTEGEVEHGSVLIHTLAFGDHLRNSFHGSSLVPSSEKRGTAGTTIDLALKHITDVSIRSHHMTYEFRVADAPHPNEIVIAMAASTSERPHARSGDLQDELREKEVASAASS